MAIDAVRKQLGDRIEYDEAHYDCANGADALVLVTEWHEFRRPSFERLKALLRQPVIFDGRNVWSPAELRTAGFTYYGMGRGKGTARRRVASSGLPEKARIGQGPRRFSCLARRRRSRRPARRRRWPERLDPAGA